MKRTAIKFILLLQLAALLDFAILLVYQHSPFSSSPKSNHQTQVQSSHNDIKSPLTSYHNHNNNNHDNSHCSCHIAHSNTSHGRGKLCLYRWENFTNCIEDVDDLRELANFPNRPTVCHTIDQFRYFYDLEIYGQRIFGYVSPPKDGYYAFVLTTNSFAELWLSNGTRPDKAKRVAWIEPWQRPWDVDFPEKRWQWVETQLSGWIYLYANRPYFVEVLHGQRLAKGYVEVRWKYFDGRYQSLPQAIHTDYLSLFPHSPNYQSPSHTVQRFVKPGIGISKVYRKQESNFSRNYHKIPKILHRNLIVLPTCRYFRPTYIVSKKTKLRTYGAVNKLQEIQHVVRGKFDYKVFNRDRLRPCNALANTKRTNSHVDRFMTALNEKYRNRYTFIENIGVEEKIDPRRGSRLLFDLVVKDNTNQKIQRISEYFYHRKVSQILCLISDVVWSPTTHVHICLAVKGQSRWVRYFIQQISDYYVKSRDEHFSVIIANFGSSPKDNFDVVKELKSSPLKNYKVIPMYKDYRNFSKTIGMDTAIRSIDDPESIVLQYDLHINFPHDLLDNVRKRCIRKRSVYMPIIVRLYCGHDLNNPNGYYERDGFGIMAFYKGDYDAVGGMQIEKFKFKWGGEDSEMADRILKHQMEIERLCHPNMFHFYHRKLDWKN